MRNDDSENEDDDFAVELQMDDEDGMFVCLDFDCLDETLSMTPAEAKALAFQLLTVAAAAEEASALLENEGLE